MTATVTPAMYPDGGDRLILADKYRGAVVEASQSSNPLDFIDISLQDLQLPPAFCIPSSEPIRLAIEQAYERDFSHIPFVRSVYLHVSPIDPGGGDSILNSRRRPLGYIDAASLKEKYEAGLADPVSTQRFGLLS